MRTNTLLRDVRGVVLIEFAIILPFLILLFLGGVNLANAMSTSRKATTAVRAIVDLTAQSSDVTKQSLNAIMAIRTPIVAPFALNDTFTRISQVQTDKDGAAKVVWSQAVKGTKLVVNAAYDLPSEYRMPNITYLVAEMDYTFAPQTAIMPLKPISMSERIIMLPRQSQEISCDDCN